MNRTSISIIREESRGAWYRYYADWGCPLMRSSKKASLRETREEQHAYCTDMTRTAMCVFSATSFPMRSGWERCFTSSGMPFILKVSTATCHSSYATRPHLHYRGHRGNVRRFRSWYFCQVHQSCSGSGRGSRTCSFRNCNIAVQGGWNSCWCGRFRLVSAFSFFSWSVIPGYPLSIEVCGERRTFPRWPSVVKVWAGCVRWWRSRLIFK